MSTIQIPTNAIQKVSVTLKHQRHSRLGTTVASTAVAAAGAYALGAGTIPSILIGLVVSQRDRIRRPVLLPIPPAATAS